LTHEEEVQILKAASDIGLSSMYDASRDSYTNWRSKVLALAAQLKKEQDDRTV
jgi:hypothetical protein